MTKKCTGCGETKTLDQFYKDARHKDKCRSRCKTCTRADDRQYCVTNPDKARERHRVYRSDNREQLREFGRRWYADNRERSLERTRKWQKENLGRHRENARNRYAADPDRDILKANCRRARKLGNGVFAVTTEERRQLKTQCCYLCGVAPSTALDHIIPLSRGGRDSIGNLLGVCKSCNSSKKDMYLSEFKRWRYLRSAA